MGRLKSVLMWGDRNSNMGRSEFECGAIEIRIWGDHNLNVGAFGIIMWGDEDSNIGRSEFECGALGIIMWGDGDSNKGRSNENVGVGVWGEITLRRNDWNPSKTVPWLES
jgi:hypothetical protein